MLTIRHLEAQDIEMMTAAFQKIGWNKSVSLFESYFDQQSSGKRLVLVAIMQGLFAGYLTINWQSDYPSFKEQNIPEIQDFNVLPEFRRQGIGTRLMDEAEEIIGKRSPVVGIGFGLYADYGAAQRMYVMRGYVPDGKGVFYDHQPVTPGGQMNVDDDLVLYLTKNLRIMATK